MFARVTAVQVSPGQVGPGIESFKQQVLPAAKSVDGYKGSLLLVDRATGKSIGITLWVSEEARQAAAAAVDDARKATIEAMGASVPPVDEYEVALADL